MASGFKIADAYVSVHATPDNASGKTSGEKLGDDANRGLRSKLSFGGIFKKAVVDSTAEAARAALANGDIAGAQMALGFTRTASGKLRNAQKRFVSEGLKGVEAELERRGQEGGNSFSSGLTRGVNGSRGGLLALSRLLTQIGVINVFASLAGQAVQFAAALAPAINLLATIPAIAASAAAAVATLAVGLSGIGAAFKAYGKAVGGGGGGGGAAKDTTSLQRAVESAARGIKSAERDVTRAYRDVADAQYELTIATRSYQDAARGVTEAEEEVADAARGTERAQMDLNRAREDAARKLADYQDRLTGASIDERQATLDLADARATLQNYTEWGIQGTRQFEQAQINVQKAELRLKDAQEDRADIEREAAEAAKRGVEGDESVIDAKQRVQEAIENQSDANYSLQQAQENVADSSRDVVLAQRDIEDAQQGVLDAQERVVLAQQQLADAQKALTDAGAGAGGAAGGMDQFNEALKKLSPNAQSFVKAVIALGGEWKVLKNSVQDKLFAGLDKEVTKMAKASFPTLTKGMGQVAEAFNSMAKGASIAVQNPVFQGALAEVFNQTARSVDAIGSAMAPFLTGMMKLAAVASPFLTQFSTWVADNMRAAGIFLQSAEGAQRMHDAIQRGVTTLQQFWEISKNLGSVIGNIFNAVDSKSFLDNVIQITDRWDKWTASAEGQEAIKETFRVLNQFGSSLVQILPKIANVLGAINDIFQRLPGPVKELILQTAAWAIVLGPMIGLVTRLGSAMSLLGAKGRAGAAGVAAIGGALIVVDQMWGKNVRQADAFIAKLGNLNSANLDELTAANTRLAEQFNKTGGAAISFKGALNWPESRKLNDQAKEIGERFEALTRIYQNAAHATGLTEKEVQDLAVAMDFGSIATKDLKEYSGQLADQLTDEARSLKDTTVGQEALKSATDVLNAATSTATDKQRAFQDAINATLGLSLSAEDAEIRLAEATSRLGQDYQTAGGKADIHTEAGRRLRQSMLDATRAILDETNAMAADGRISDDAATKKQRNIDKLNELKAAYPGLAPEIQKHIDKLNQIPATKGTKVEVDAKGANSVLDSLLDKLGKFANKVVQFGGQVVNTVTGKRASGGPVGAFNTYLVGERGPEFLTMGAGNGYVTNARKTSDMLAASNSSSNSGTSIHIGELTLQVNGSLDMTSEADKRRFITQVRDGLVGLEGEQR